MHPTAGHLPDFHLPPDDVQRSSERHRGMCFNAVSFIAFTRFVVTNRADASTEGLESVRQRGQGVIVQVVRRFKMIEGRST